MFGFSGGELLVVLVVAALVMGPKNVAQALHGLRKLLNLVREWSAKLRQETAFDLSSLGIDPADVEKLKNLDLSQYDPRQMVREAVQEEMTAWIAATNGAAAAGKVTAAGAAAAMQQAVTPFPADVAPAQSPLKPDGSQATDGSPSNVAAAPNYLTTPVLYSETPSTFTPSSPSTPPATGPTSQTTLSADLPGQSATGGRGTSSSDIISDDDEPLDLHTILNRPDLGGSR